MITDYIPQGQSVTRAQLAELTGLPDRRVRGLIAKARDDGIPIIASGKGGYTVAADADELEQFCRRELRRAVTIMRRVRPLLRKAEWEAAIKNHYCMI
jgi:alkylated DNA nucleotide flippase Atl1